VAAELASLDSVNVTWVIPSDSNAPIESYTLMFCARLGMGCVDGTSTNVTFMVWDEEIIRIGENLLRVRYRFSEILINREYEVVIRAENYIGRQMSPVFGNGFRFNSTSPDDGQVVNIGFVPTATMIILTWNLPTLALTTTNLNVSFNVTYYNVGAPLNTISVTVDYDPIRLEQGVSVNIGEPDSPLHTFQITALYTNPNLLSSQATLGGVRTLEIGTRITIIDWYM
jgi:hypothetical protein